MGNYFHRTHGLRTKSSYWYLTMCNSYLKAAEQADKFQKALGKQDWDAALNACEELVRLLPDNASIHYNHGLVLRKLGRNVDARRSLQTALQLAPAHHNALFELACATLEDTQYDRAIGLFEDYLKHVPGDGDAVLNLANCFLKIGNPGQAIKLLETLSNLDNSPKAKIALATAFRDCGRLDDCIDLLGKLDTSIADLAIARQVVLTKGNRGRINIFTGKG